MFFGIPLSIFLLILSIIIIFVVFRSWEACKNTAEQVNFWSIVQSLFILLELIGLSLYAIFKFITNLSMQSQFLNITSSSNLKEFITTNPTGGISILVGIISIITVYLYFFTVLSKTKYFSEISEVQEKYNAIFWQLPVFLLLFGLIILIVTDIIYKIDNNFDIALFTIGVLNIIFTTPLAFNLKKYFYNLNLSDSDGLKQGDYDYKFLENFQKIKTFLAEEWTSDNILIMTIILAGLALFFNCNIFILLMTEFCLLVAHFWSSQLKLIPKKKTTIELMYKDSSGNYFKITDVFILSESSKGYFVVLDEHNQKSKIMKNTIHKLIDQKEQ